eukprot:CAMPEP_0201476224 /NCGR_PEP_ID=MMETSP0151_2-20130828/1476_1 /ASSEMBLY_ACC=CAM_ASM_000257 /TAXON_ID=200890 /ORGANISM="Paramoeba atlantica, Strain 621/1 / CCAP 1560/9" /LENGTH=83 /DNA_ID=CAMNT_0047856527 /DNA_START=68 /DNA_END=319 /DNA_ORIENTATION=+
MAQQQSLMGHINTQEEVIEAFRCFDKDNTGFLDISILRQILSDLGDVMEDFEIEDLIRHADFQKSGQIKYADFVALMFLYDQR